MSGLELIAVSAAASLAGTGLSAYGQISGGNARASAANAAANYQLQSGLIQQRALQAGATEARAVAGQKAQESDIEKKLALSKLAADAGASGGGSADTTVVNLAAGIENLGQYDKFMKLYAGLRTWRGRTGGELPAKNNQSRYHENDY